MRQLGFQTVSVPEVQLAVSVSGDEGEAKIGELLPGFLCFQLGLQSNKCILW